MTALDVIFSPGVLDKVKQEFREAKLREEKSCTSPDTGSGDDVGFHAEGSPTLSA